MNQYHLSSCCILVHRTENNLTVLGKDVLKKLEGCWGRLFLSKSLPETALSMFMHVLSMSTYKQGHHLAWTLTRAPPPLPSLPHLSPSPSSSPLFRIFAQIRWPQQQESHGILNELSSAFATGEFKHVDTQTQHTNNGIHDKICTEGMFLEGLLKDLPS